MTLSHSALAASGLSVDEGLRAVTVIYVGARLDLDGPKEFK